MLGRKTADSKGPRSMIRRIAYVVRTFPRLSQTFVTQELDWLLCNGFDCRIFCLHRSDEALTQTAARSPRILARLHRLDQASDAILAGFSPDIIHCPLRHRRGAGHARPRASASGARDDHGHAQQQASHGKQRAQGYDERWPGGAHHQKARSSTPPAPQAPTRLQRQHQSAGQNGPK